MIKIEEFMQLKAFARMDALLLTALWTVSFACVTMIGAGTMGNLLALATPFFIGWRTCRFRNNVLGGAISLRRAYAYSLYNFVYASLVFALVQFVYFRFVDNGGFVGLLTDTMKAMAPVYEQNGISRTELKQNIDMLTQLTPIQWSFVFMIQNFFLGALASLPIALVCRRRQ